MIKKEETHAHQVRDSNLQDELAIMLNRNLYELTKVANCELLIFVSLMMVVFRDLHIHVSECEV